MRTWPPTTLAKYPHMMPQDIPIWNRYLAQYAQYYTKFVYDFPVGEGSKVPFPIDEKFKADYEHLTKKRIDVVGYKPTAIDIIEIKPRAATTALGQVLTYRTLFIAQENPTQPIKAIVITDSITEDDRKVYTNFGIEIIIV